MKRVLANIATTSVLFLGVFGLVAAVPAGVAIAGSGEKADTGQDAEAALAAWQEKVSASMEELKAKIEAGEVTWPFGPKRIMDGALDDADVEEFLAMVEERRAAKAAKLADLLEQYESGALDIPEGFDEEELLARLTEKIEKLSEPIDVEEYKAKLQEKGCFGFFGPFHHFKSFKGEVPDEFKQKAEGAGWGTFAAPKDGSRFVFGKRPGDKAGWGGGFTFRKGAGSFGKGFGDGFGGGFGDKGHSD